MRLYDTRSSKVGEFKPLTKKQLSIYVCGITPYDTTHLGHAFVYVAFDALIRYFQFKGYDVNYTQNVTDIDDDILKKAAESGRDWKELGQFWTNIFVKDLKNLNVILPTHYVKATDSIKKIIEMNKKLVEKNHAYLKGNNLYFRTKSFSKYGDLSKLSREEMIEISAERGADPKDPNKEDPLDFIIWQGTREGEPFWQSPWGEGRPGWHIECSAMINQFLGDQIDIHGGGGDLVFPHHESEIAQSESFTGKSPFVGTWMHIGMLKFKGEKMSKSLGNLVMVSELLKQYSASAIRYLLLSHHYRSEWEFSESDLILAADKVRKITSNQGDRKKFEAALEDDFNTPEALKYAGIEELKILGFTY